MIDLTKIIEAHRCAASNCTILCVPLGDGEPCILFGEIAENIDVGIPTVTLLSARSNPRFWIQDPLAPGNFESAINYLLQERKPFYSIPRRGWVFPAFYWREIARVDSAVLN